METTIQPPWFCSKPQAKKLSCLVLASSFLLSMATAATSAETTAKSEASAQATNTGKISETTVPVHQTSAQTIQAKKAHDFWRNLMHNRKIAWFAGTLDAPTDTIETTNEVKLYCEVPGLDESTLDITVEKDNVIIKGDKKIDTEQKADDFRRIERAYGSFEKTVRLPAQVDTEGATATLKNGILTVLLPKSVEAKNEGKKLSIRHD